MAQANYEQALRDSWAVRAGIKYRVVHLRTALRKLELTTVRVPTPTQRTRRSCAAVPHLLTADRAKVPCRRGPNAGRPRGRGPARARARFAGRCNCQDASIAPASATAASAPAEDPRRWCRHEGDCLHPHDPVQRGGAVGRCAAAG